MVQSLHLEAIQAFFKHLMVNFKVGQRNDKGQYPVILEDISPQDALRLGIKLERYASDDWFLS